MKPAVALTRARVRAMRPPAPPQDADKNGRGTVLVIGGSTGMPGAILLAGTAALRAGAGKLQIATVASAATPLGVAVPEALLVALPETRSGDIDGGHCSAALSPHIRNADAILVGPGMQSRSAVRELLHLLLDQMRSSATLVMDAEAIPVLKDEVETGFALDARLIITPHGGEMATLLDRNREEIENRLHETAVDAARELNAVVALKGADCFIADPSGDVFCYRAGKVGLATSGSGDVLAGIVGGLAARGAEPFTAACCAVYVHGEAGNALAKRVAPIGFLARELLAEIPTVLAQSER